MTRQQTVIVYTTPLCAPCEVLKRVLTTEGIPFTVQDLMVDEAAASLLESRGIRTAPALGIDGEIYAGEDLRFDRLVELLDL
jgi:glutaredoxin